MEETALAIICQQCDRFFGTYQALQQHLRDSPAHAMTFDCEECDRTFKTDQALQQHLRDSLSHAAILSCEECDRTFKTDQALQQHLRDSPIHIASFSCEECNRTFSTDQALQQHLRDSPAHTATDRAIGTSHSFDMRPALHDDVSRLLLPHGLSFEFFAADDLHGVLKEHDSSIMGGQASKSPLQSDGIQANGTTLEYTTNGASLVTLSVDQNWTTLMQRESHIGLRNGLASLWKSPLALAVARDHIKHAYVKVVSTGIVGKAECNFFLAGTRSFHVWSWVE
ncbi:hypothetical protein LTR22_027325 [Elasticomyces elasticus]|nr:hypothetical protein LTR22_027325 [Elasticomyces elasticus]